MRGKVPTRSCQALARGITPAYAGKSIQRGRPDHASRDHPRVCGEKHLCSGRPLSLWGSPPRMRGKAEPGFVLWVTSGITPAYAGKSTPSRCSWACIRDHPRVCGEKEESQEVAAPGKGSPPRMRGKVGKSRNGRAHRGITPAYAGKSLTIQKLSTLRRDHPRVCGEKTKKIPSHRPFQLHPVPVSFSFA